jgi:hypothetical protein
MPSEKLTVKFEVFTVMLLMVQVFWDVIHMGRVLPDVSKDCVLPSSASGSKVV